MTAFKRKIFYLSGFDPRGARFYHQLYAEQAGLFNTMAKRDISVGPRGKAPGGNNSWAISDNDGQAETEIIFLGWDDIIRAHWVKNPLRLLGRSLKSYIAFSRQMDWRHGRKFPRGTLIAFYYPGVSSILLPILMTLLLWAVMAQLMDWPWSVLAALAAGIGTASFIIRKIQSFWLLRFIIFNDSLASNDPDPLIEKRLDEMAATINAALEEPYDEVMFATHSNGSILAVPIMQRLLALNDGKMPDKFALMTLGSCIPLIGCRQDSVRFHGQLEKVAAGEFLWLDLGSLTDGACIPLIDPCGSCETPERPTMHVLSPRWFRYSDPETYDARRKNKYETHFDYLRTFDRLSPLDYIAVTSGPRPLRESIAAFQAENA